MQSVTSPDGELDDVVAAYGRLLAARAEEPAALDAARQAVCAWWLAHRQAVPKGRVADRVRGALLAAGWSPEQVQRVGVSGPSMKNTLAGLR